MAMATDHGNLDPMRSVPAGQFKQHCLRLLDEVGASGEPIVITKRGRAVAQLTSVSPVNDEDWRGSMRDHGEITGDIVSPALSPDEWDALRG